MSVMTKAAPKYRRPSLWKTLRKHQASYLMIAPYFILFFFFTVLPVLMSMVVSFTDWNMLEMPNFVGWKNYVKLLLEHADLRCGHRPGELHAVSAVRVDHQ